MITTPSPRVRRLSLAVGAAAVFGSAILGACASKDDTKEKPAEGTTSPPSATAPATATEKAVDPSTPAGSGGGNSFAPTVTAPPAPTALPGNVITGG